MSTILFLCLSKKLKSKAHMQNSVKTQKQKNPKKKGAYLNISAMMSSRRLELQKREGSKQLLFAGLNFWKRKRGVDTNIILRD